MKNENSDVQKQHGKSRKFKIISWIFIGAAGFVLLLFFGLPLYLSSAGGKNLLLGKINQSVDGQVKMDHLSVGWFKGVKLTNLSYADTSGNTSIKVQSIETQPHYVALLSGKVKLGNTVIEKPQVFLKVPKAGEETAAAETQQTASKTKSSGGSETAFPIDQMNLQVIDGSATVEMLDNPSQTVKFSNIASNVQIAGAGNPSSVDVSMNVDQNAKVSAKGTLTPAKKGWTLKEGDFEVRISKLDLASLRPLLALAGQESDMAGQLNADATVQVKDNAIQRLKADAEITGFAQGSGTQRTVFDKPITLSALLVGSGKTVKIENAMVKSAFCTADCSGTLESLNYQIDANLAQTQQFAGQFVNMQGMAVQGQLAAQGKVDMTDNRIGVTGTGTAQKLIIEKDGVQTPVTDVKMDFDCAVDKTANQFKLASANLTAMPGTVNLSNLALPLSGEGQKSVSLDARAKLDLGKTWPFVQVFTELPKDIQIAGMLDSAVKVSTKGSQVQLLTDNTRIDQLKITRPDSEPFVQDKVTLNGDVVLDTAQQTIDIRRLDMQAANGESLIKITKGQVGKTVSGNTTKLAGNLQAQYDLKTVTAFASPFLPQGLVLEGKRNDTVHFESQYPTDQPDLMKKNLNASASFGFDKAQYQGLNFGPTKVAVNVKQGQATIDIPDADVNGGKVRFTGNVNLAEKPMMLRLNKSEQVVENVKIDDVISAKLLQYLNPMFFGATGVTGTANLSCSSLAIPLGGGNPKDIHLDGAIGLTDVRLNSPLLGLFKQAMRTEGLDLFSIPVSPFTVKDGFVKYEDMPMMFGKNFGLHFGGAIGLDKSLAMNVGVPVNDRIVQIPLGGTLVSPKPDFGKLVLNSLIDQIPTKNEKDKSDVEKGLEILDSILNKRDK